ITDPAQNPAHLKMLEDWLRSYRPDELFEPDGKFKEELRGMAPSGERRMGSNPHANGGLLLKDLHMPDFTQYGIDVPKPGITGKGDTRILGPFLRDVLKANAAGRNFRLFGPDETVSNGLQSVFEVTNRQWLAETREDDDWLARSGQVMEV